MQLERDVRCVTKDSRGLNHRPSLAGKGEESV